MGSPKFELLEIGTDHPVMIDCRDYTFRKLREEINCGLLEVVQYVREDGEVMALLVDEEGRLNYKPTNHIATERVGFEVVGDAIAIPLALFENMEY